MAPISDNWPDVEASLDILGQEEAYRITSLVETLQPYYRRIEEFVSSCHPQQLPCHLVTDHYTWGRAFLVYEVVFEDGLSWILRFGFPPIDEYFNTSEQLERKILNEVAALHLVRARTTIPVPQVIAHHAHPSPTNPLGGASLPAFMLMTALQGMTIADCGIDIDELGSYQSGSGVAGGALPDPLGGDESRRPILQRYLRDIADIHVQLSRITFDKIGSFAFDTEGQVVVGPGADFGLGPFESASEYFDVQAQAYEHLARAAGEQEQDAGDEDTNADDGHSDYYDAEENFPDGDEDCCAPAGGAGVVSGGGVLKRRFVASLWSKAMTPLIDARDEHGPFPMRHGDLHCDNILVDTTGHIIGVLDWDCAGTVPWEVFAIPTFEVTGHFAADDFSGSSSSSSSSSESSSSSSCSSSAEDLLATPPPPPSRPEAHYLFNEELRKAELRLDEGLNNKSGRSLAMLHDSDAGHVGSFLAYWMYSLGCDYDHTGRALHRMIGSEDDIDDDFRKFAEEVNALDVEMY